MQIDETFRQKIGLEISDNRSELAASSIDWLKSTFHDYRKIAAFKTSYNNKEVELEFGIKFILDAITEDRNLSVRVPWSFPRHFNENHIYFDLSFTTAKLRGNYEEDKFIKETSELKKLNDLCFKAFWEANKLKDSINMKFDPFLTKVVKSEQIGMAYGYAVLLFDNENWIKYYIQIIETLFDKYPLQKSYSSSKTLRFARPLTSDLYFGFEIDLTQSVANIRNGDLMTPNFNVILFSSKFKKSVSPRRYLLPNHDLIMSFGILGNPFFFYPCIPLLSYCTIKQMDDKRSEYLYVNQLIDEKDGNVKIIGPSEFGEWMKKYAFFYLSILRDSSETYLTYLENCILKAAGTNCG